MEKTSSKEVLERRIEFKKKTIGVLMGGMSVERDISLKSGSCVVKALAGLGYKTIAIDFGRDAAKRLKDESIDAAYIALHGKYGEDGAIQGLLEIIALPYTGSGIMASAIAMDKCATKAFLGYRRIPTPEYAVLKDGAVAAANFDFPVVVKPSKGGSTIGVSLVKDQNHYQQALREAYKYGSTVIVEKFIKGRELTVGVLNEIPLPVVEIMPKEEIFSFKSKYLKGMAEFKAPASLEEKLERDVKGVALDAYMALGCRGAARVDMMVDDNGQPYVLEVNTVPGMTETSLLPMAAAAMGIGYPALVETILFSAGLEKN